MCSTLTTRREQIKGVVHAKNAKRPVTARCCGGQRGRHVSAGSQSGRRTPTSARRGAGGAMASAEEALGEGWESLSARASDLAAKAAQFGSEAMKSTADCVADFKARASDNAGEAASGVGNYAEHVRARRLNMPSVFPSRPERSAPNGPATRKTSGRGSDRKL